MYLYLFLVGPMLLTCGVWYYQECQYSAMRLSFSQIAWLVCFVSYVFFCLLVGKSDMVDLFNDHHYKMGRALSVNGLWTYIVPGLVGPLLVFPRVIQLYVLNQSTAGPYAVWLGYLLVFFILLRHLFVV